MVKLYFVIPYGLMATLADLTVAADDLEHDLARDRTGVRPAIFSLSKRFRHEVYGAEVPENSTRSFRQQPWYSLGIVVSLVVSYHLPKGPLSFSVQRFTVCEATRAECRTQVLIVILHF
jgi:hypothetical protein